MTKLEKEQRRLGRQIRQLNRSVVDELKAALEILNGAAKLPIEDLPTRQQRRHAARQAQKAGR